MKLSGHPESNCRAFKYENKKHTLVIVMSSVIFRQCTI